MWFLIIATVIIGALLYKLLWLRSNDFWKKLGIRQIDTSPAVGILDILLRRKILPEADVYAYNKMGSTDKYCGVIEFGNPTLLVKDTELLKKIFIKDFDHFVNRRQMFSKEDGIITKMLFSLEGDEWRTLRIFMTPTFTSGKIRRMMEIFNSVGKEWASEYKRKAELNGGSVVTEVQNSANEYTVEVISNTAFGMSGNVIKNPEAPFIKMANRLANVGKRQVITMVFRLLAPRLASFLRLSLFDLTPLKYYETILQREWKSRLNGDTKRNDFLQLMVDAKKGELQASGSDELSSFERDAQISAETTDSEKKQQYLRDEIMNAQCVAFFLAGYLPPSAIITFTLYALAVHPDVQKRLKEEVDEIFNEDGNLDYDDVGKLVYMDMVVCEILRIVSVPRLERMCVKDYKDPESGLEIPKGTAVGIPVYGIHYDKEYYDNPEKFDPEHFSPEKKAARNPYAFLPFGMGPRNCIGMRFALIEVKTAIAHMLHNFIIEPTAKTPTTFKLVPSGVQFSPPKNLEVRLTPVTS